MHPLRPEAAIKDSSAYSQQHPIYSRIARVRLGEAERLESASSQRQPNALKLSFRAGRPAVGRSPNVDGCTFDIPKKHLVRLGEPKRFESDSSQRRANALKLRFRAGRPAVRRNPNVDESAA